MMMSNKEFYEAFQSLEKCIKIFQAGLSKEIEKEDWEAAKNIEKLCASYLNHFASAQESRYIFGVDRRLEVK
jgi:flagellin-specific chaperone FliS